MSIFEENAWETNETGDKLAKELILGRKKKTKLGKKTGENVKQAGKKFVAESENQKNKNGEGNRDSVARSKANNKKRKASEITIDESLIKKWKSESMGKAAPRHDAETLKQEFSKKITKLAEDLPTRNLEKKNAGKTASKKRKSESKEQADKLDKKKKLNGTRSDTSERQVQSENDSETGNVMTKSRKRRLKRKKNLLNKAENEQKNSRNLDNSASEASDAKREKESKKMDKSRLKIDRLQSLLVDKQKNASKSNGKLSEPKSLRDRMLDRLKSSRFRYLNEQMYNSESWSSKKYFKEDPDAFAAYHEGYKLQVNQWPLNPLDTIITSINKLPKDYIVADFGCGEARLANSVTQKVHSLDLVAINDTVTACDMAHTSLLTSRIDVVVFCLSLMGTNLTDYLIEANRVLRKDGILKIAEVESRFEDVDEFAKTLASYGFVNTWKDLSHNLFYFMDFKKDTDITKKRNKLPPVTLKSCLYKRR